MEHISYAARLRYLDASQVDDAVVSYDGLDVVGPDHEKLGDLDGFIVDADAGRVYYVVIDTAGWFRTKQLLLPVGHATLDAGNRALRVDVTKDALNRYPEFDEGRFRQFTDDDLRRFESRTVDACCPEDAATVEAWAYDTRRHYTQPSWWRSSSAGAGARGTTVPGATVSAAAGMTPAPVRERHDRELVTARERDDRGSRDPDDVSPHFAGRAQPGDVLGIETGGERTHVGEDAGDEDKRRRDAERTANESRKGKGRVKGKG